jgi:phosphatidate cytidylyltransferase
VAAYLALAGVAGLGLIALRDGFGALWLLWLVLVVIASDVAGYFAGRLIGGPKLWPQVSPKKTWSGTVAGWLLALAVGAAFMPLLGQGAAFLELTLWVCIAGQAGDIAESALKRHVGVKDSSHLIPGHGGVMDRFDAMLGAAVAFQLAALAGLVPQG